MAIWILFEQQMTNIVDELFFFSLNLSIFFFVSFSSGNNMKSMFSAVSIRK